MRMNIFQQEFRMHFRSVIIWSAAVAALIFVFVSLFSSFAQDAALLNEMMANFPKELLTAFGLDGVDLSTALSFSLPKYAWRSRLRTMGSLWFLLKRENGRQSFCWPSQWRGPRF
jgi:hypothetical protein